MRSSQRKTRRRFVLQVNNSPCPFSFAPLQGSEILACHRWVLNIILAVKEITASLILPREINLYAGATVNAIGISQASRVPPDRCPESRALIISTTSTRRRRWKGNGRTEGSAGGRGREDEGEEGAPRDCGTAGIAGIAGTPTATRYLRSRRSKKNPSRASLEKIE